MENENSLAANAERRRHIKLSPDEIRHTVCHEFGHVFVQRKFGYGECTEFRISVCISSGVIEGAAPCKSPENLTLEADLVPKLCGPLSEIRSRIGGDKIEPTWLPDLIDEKSFPKTFNGFEIPKAAVEGDWSNCKNPRRSRRLNNDDECSEQLRSSIGIINSDDVWSKIVAATYDLMKDKRLQNLQFGSCVCLTESANEIVMRIEKILPDS